MEFDMVLLADAATGHEGKLFIHGGGLTRITPPQLPWMHPQLAVVIRIAVEPGDLEEPHELALSLHDPEGDPVLPRTVVPWQAIQPSGVEGEETYVQLALTFSGLPFQREGVHHWVFELDGRPARKMAMPVSISAGSTAEVDAEPPQVTPSQANPTST